MKDKRKLVYAFILALILILVFSFSTILNLIVEYKWFDHLGYRNTFLMMLTGKYRVGIPIFIFCFTIIYLYIEYIKKSFYKEIEIGKKHKTSKLEKINKFGIPLLVSFIFVNGPIGNLWFSILEYLNKVDFNQVDPIFNRDISFYIFTLPLLRELVGLVILFIFLLVIVNIGINASLYLGENSKNKKENSKVFYIDGKEFKDNFKNIGENEFYKNILSQVSILIGLVFLVMAVNYYLNTFQLVYSSRGVAYGASYTDVNIGIWLYRLLAIASLIAGVTVVVGIRKNKLKTILVGPAIVIGIIFIGNIGMAGVQRFVVEPDEISKEREFLEYNLEYTKKAFGIDKVEEYEFPVSQDISVEDINNNKDIVDNIRINDYRPISQVYNQLQAFRLYYKFNSVDVGRYYIDGEYRQVFISPRELDQRNLQNPTWINSHIKYTHGYGLAMSYINSVTADGQPDLLIKNIPIETSSDLIVSRPEIYFGQLTNDYIIVNTDEKEFHYPTGSDNQETSYEGEGGISLKGINRLIFSLKERSFRMFVSNNINENSRIIFDRNISDRIKKIAPFIYYDENPYLIVNQEDGRLYWIIEGYTVSNRYPYSTPHGGNNINYIRNSVKVVVDAYNGSVDYYIFDEEDPIISTYSNIFKDLFKSKEDMPEGIRAHIRYPHRLFNIQSEVYRRYHVNNPVVFYNEEDLYDIAQEKYMQGVQRVEPIYQMFKLPGEEDIEFLLTIPYTPKSKQNMTALLAARNDGDNYGQLFLYRLPKGRTINGPMMIESRIDQNTSISELLTLWSQEGSRVLRGNVTVIPIEDSLLYVEPIYLQSDNENSLPEMKRVIVSFRDQMVMEETLDLSLRKIFGDIDYLEETFPIEEEEEVIDELEEEILSDINQLIERANDLFIKSKNASQSGNWSLYGEYMEELEKTLNELNNLNR